MGPCRRGGGVRGALGAELGDRGSATLKAYYIVEVRGMKVRVITRYSPQSPDQLEHFGACAL